MKLHGPIFKILKLRKDENFDIWQMETFDELISMNVDICKLIDKDIELIFEVVNRGQGTMKLFKGNFMKSGLNMITINNADIVGTVGTADAADDVDAASATTLSTCPIITRTIPIPPTTTTADETLVKLEKALYMRKSKQVANWQIQLMKEKLKELKKKFFNLNPETFIIKLIIPIPSHPLKLKTTEAEVIKSDEMDLCMRDIEESQEDSRIKRKYPEIFYDDFKISNGDLRALKGILLQRSEGIPVDAANLLWTHREYLSRRFPSGIIQFVESVQWWLAESDPTEIDEAMRVIKNWRFPCDKGIKMEIGSMLMVEMCKLNGLNDSVVWLNVFKKLITDESGFRKKFRSALILFLTRKETAGLKELKQFFKQVLFGEGEINQVSELYWRLKTLENDFELFEEYKKGLSNELMAELRKQEKLFEAIETVLMSAQKIKGPRSIKLEFIKKSLDDPESGIPSATQQHPLIPGLLQDDGRVAAIVSDRSNLFKSTSFTVLLVFLRLNQEREHLSLPIIFKKGDDLRRDSACLRVFRAIWDIWRDEGGLKLFPKELLYGVTALSNDFGLVEFIESVPLSKIVNVEEEGGAGEWALVKHLNSLNEKESTRNFLTSCVGFSLLTYLLGIGDRHLDNLLLTPQGRLLHIDFSFVFGADPKPFPPPIKITREMVRGFEGGSVSGGGGGNLGDNSSNFEKWSEFKGLCFTALTLLRRKSPLILSLIECEYPATHTQQYQQFVRERLGVMVSQAEAVQRLDKLMEESRVAMFPVVMETIHKWVQYWKS